jgi:hypothetical protein
MIDAWKTTSANLQQQILQARKRHRTKRVDELLQQQQLYRKHLHTLFFVQRKELLFYMSDFINERVGNLQDTPLVFDNDAAVHATDLLESDGIKQVLNFYGVRTFAYEGQYFLLSNLWDGVCEERALFEKKYLATTTQKYRIMLMPLLEKIPLVLVYFFNALQKDPSLRSLVARVSLIKSFEQHDQLPIITITATSGHVSAQQLLEKLIAISKVCHGLDQAPRWSDTITSLLYVTQGDDEQRLLPAYEHKFVLPAKAIFVGDLMGDTLQYQLTAPVELPNVHSKPK